MGNFLLFVALKIIAEDCQQCLLDRLNKQIKGYFSLFLATPHSCGILGLTNVRRGVCRHQYQQGVAQIVISTAPQDSPMLAFNYVRETHAQQQFLSSPPPKNKFKTLTPLAPVGQKPPTAPAQNHESALTDKPLDPQHTHTPAAQLRSLVDLRTYVVVAAQGTHSGGSASAFWLVTGALGRLGVVATYAPARSSSQSVGNKEIE